MYFIYGNFSVLYVVCLSCLSVCLSFFTVSVVVLVVFLLTFLWATLPEINLI